MVLKFPPVELADAESGLLAVGGDLEVPSLELAYRSGIFPWPHAENQPLLWFAPKKRAVLFFDQFKIPRRLQRDIRRSDLEFRVDTCFAEVIRACAASKTRKGCPGTWIIPEMVDAYIDFHHMGFAHSFEAFNPEGKLVGGMYGVSIGTYFAGESMFFLESNASKFAFVGAVEHLRGRGMKWLDVQVMTPLVEMLGAVEIPRAVFMQLLDEALNGTV